MLCRETAERPFLSSETCNQNEPKKNQQQQIFGRKSVSYRLIFNIFMGHGWKQKSKVDFDPFEKAIHFLPNYYRRSDVY